MAVPKNKTPRSRRDSGRNFKRLHAAARGKCPRCHEDKLPHRVCASCGYYKDFEVLEIKD